MKLSPLKLIDDSSIQSNFETIERWANTNYELVPVQIIGTDQRAYIGLSESTVDGNKRLSLAIYANSQYGPVPTENTVEDKYGDLVKLYDEVDITDVKNQSTTIRFTPEGGLAIKLANRTGAPSVKGSVVHAYASADKSFELQSNEYDAIGVVYEDDVADGSWCWVVVSGIADVLIEDGAGAARSQLAICAPTDGRAKAIDVPSSNPVVGEHFKEIGHFIESKNDGTDVLCKAVLHFN